jgi:hypothetical protein
MMRSLLWHRRQLVKIGINLLTAPGHDPAPESHPLREDSLIDPAVNFGP